MNKKAVKTIINNKIEHWLKFIEDKELAKELRNNVIVTGGCIKSLLLGEEVKDFDIYFTNKETTKKVAEYYINKFNEKYKNKLSYSHKAFVLDGADYKEVIKGNKTSAEIVLKFENQKITSRMIANITEDRIKIIVISDGVASENENLLKTPFEDIYDVLDEADKIDSNELKKDGKELYRPIFLSTNAITLSNKVQLVIRFYGDPEEIHKNYDFVHCTNYWTKKSGLVLKQGALESILSKELIYVGSKYPVCSVIRTRKFLKDGWHINAGQYLKMLFQVSELDLSNIDVLEEQLIGVDTAYFMILIDALRKKQESNANFDINYSYIVSIIDKIF